MAEERETDQPAGAVSGYDRRADSLAHIHLVRDRIGTFVAELLARGRAHDASKLQEPEKSAFDRVLPSFDGVPYGSPEYEVLEASMAEAIAHHHRVNTHHPEHYGQAGVGGMDLFDLVEMVWDWMSAAERRPSNGVRLDYNTALFGIEPQLAAIIANTLGPLTRA